MQTPLIIGVMGGGTATAAQTQDAYLLGTLIAQKGWILLNGGRKAGIMDASAKGARDNGGITVGILPDDHAANVSDHIMIPILTGMGNARNTVNVLSSSIVVACAGGAGTLSEIALALKSDRTVILLNFDVRRTFPTYVSGGRLLYAESPAQVVELIEKHIPPASAESRA